MAVARLRVGQAARVSIDAFPGREFGGRVGHVAPVPLRPNWLAAGEKVYPVRVALDKRPEGLGPGMSADVAFVVGQETGEVLAVPVQALLTPTPTGQRLCVVRTPAGLEQREVVLGQTTA